MRSLLASTRLATLCLLVAVLGACSLFTRSIERPTADVRDVSVSSAGFSGMTGELHLDVANPNGFGVPLAGIDWQLSVGGARAVTGSIELSQTIPAKGVAPVTTALTIDARDAIAVASEISRGARSYQLNARLRFSTPVGPLDVDVQHSGQLSEARGLLGSLR
jgi:LEA14-like dessication related protein